MKKNVLVVLALAVGAAAFAIDPVNPKLVVITNKNAGVFKVIYDGAQSGTVKMNVLNTAGKVVFSETIRCAEGFVQPLNFSGMKKGEYTIEVIDAGGRQVHQVKYEGEESTLNVHVARVNPTESKYLVALASREAGSVYVRIFDGNNAQVHEQTLKVAGEFGVVYNLKQVTGAPTFEITDSKGITKVVRF